MTTLYSRVSMDVPSEVADLVARYERNRDSYRLGKYNETQLRQEFINPLFEILGWDVRNTSGHAEQYKDVIHEDAIKIGGSTKAPDYCFRIGGTREFFVEAKKPSVDVRGDPGPAYQLRRYAWSAKLAVSILTDFEDFAVYDCRPRPMRTDKASTARILLLNYKDYCPRWSSIAEVFSREAVLQGSFGRFASGVKTRRGTAEVDVAFLEEIDGWRDLLARNLAIRNARLTQPEINFAVQRTIDRIVFLRICEDRGIEPYGGLKRIADAPYIYRGLMEVFRAADQRFNSGIFYFVRDGTRQEVPDELTPHLRVDDEPLRDIIRGLYYPDSPYEFSVLSSDILGQVYEQFLGKVIRLTAGHHVRVEFKPEVRRAGGVYYTPTHVVDYITKETAGRLLNGKSAAEAARLKIVDPACGSGSFLLGAYQYLLDWHLAKYLEDGASRHARRLYKSRGGDWRLSIGERKRILLNSIYGVDVDTQAVEVTKLSLLLKVLEGETQDTLAGQLHLFQERALPDLGGNIKCGNSLIASDVYAQDELDLPPLEKWGDVNPLDWQKEFKLVFERRPSGFDVVIGNPPYDVLEKERDTASWPHAALASYVQLRPDYEPALGGKLNLYRFFVVRSLQLLREGGRLGMIVPMSLLADISTASTRKHLFASSKGFLADCFPQKDNAGRRIFKDAKLSTTVVSCVRVPTSPEPRNSITVRVFPWNSFRDRHTEVTVRVADLRLLDPENAPVPLVDAQHWDLCRRIHADPRCVRLGELPDFAVTRGEVNQTILRRFISSDGRKARFLKGVEITRYGIRSRLSQGHREWFDARAFAEEGKDNPRAALRRIATQRITGVDEEWRIVATMVEPVTYFADSTNSIVCMPGSAYSDEYLLALLNSRLMQWRFKVTSSNNNVGTNELETLPVRVIDLANREERGLHDELIRLAKRMAQLTVELQSVKRESERNASERRVAATDSKIDAAVYQLYGLSARDIAIVLSPLRPGVHDVVQ